MQPVIVVIKKLLLIRTDIAERLAVGNGIIILKIIGQL